MERLMIWRGKSFIVLKTSDNTEKFARYILLGNKEEALSYLSRISEHDLDYLKTLPIYHFMNE